MIANEKGPETLIINNDKAGSRVDPTRLSALISRFHHLYGERPSLRFFSAPGRAEIGGNHTDHQHGRVLAAAVNLDILCVAAPNDSGIIRVDSLGSHHLSLNDLALRESENNTSASLIRGICSRFIQSGYKIAGFDACLTSDVLVGSGLSSSAAFEVAISTILNCLFNDGLIAPEKIALISQYAENVYFRKPSGLMDQMTSAVGGLVMIDFADPERPELERIDYDFSESGHFLCVTGPLGSHSDLTDAYAAITGEMRLIASYFKKDTLREVEPEAFYRALPVLRTTVPDRAILRASHFFSENARALSQARALQRRDFAEFLRLVNESGHSSFQYLQNVCHGDDMILAIALSESERVLAGTGASRVHGGGFAGTIQAFVPYEKLDEYSATMDRLFGAGSCHVLNIRSEGAGELDIKAREL